MMTNFLGAVIILFLLSAQNISKSPGGGVVRKVEGSYDADRLILHGQVAGVQVGDTLLMIVKNNEELCREKIAGANGHGGKSGDRPGGGRPYVDTTGMWQVGLPREQQAEQIIIESLTTSACNDAGTPDAGDDTYTVELKVVKTGQAGISYRVDEKTATYNTNATFGPYRLRDGPKTITVRDGQNAALMKTSKINPPPPCNPPPPLPPVPPTPEAPGMVNFYASWDDPTDKVNIYVKKGNAWVYGGRTFDARIGEFSEFQAKTGPLKRRNTNVETVRQLQHFIPGTYQIYLHYKGNKKQEKNKPAVAVTLWLLNKKNPGDSRPFPCTIPFSAKDPKNGGGQLVKTVEITEEGKFIIR